MDLNVAMAKSLTEQTKIICAANEAIKVLQAIIKDAEAGYRPRYTGHVDQWVKSIEASAVRLQYISDNV